MCHYGKTGEARAPTLRGWRNDIAPYCFHLKDGRLQPGSYSSGWALVVFICETAVLPGDLACCFGIRRLALGHVNAMF